MKFTSLLKLKLIYVFRINDAAHQGCLKVGEATCDSDDVTCLAPNSKALNDSAKRRINQYTQTARIAYDLLYTELTIYNSKKKGLCSFNDKEVHNVLERSGIKKKVFDTANKANEWFITDLDTVKRAIAAVKEGRESLSTAEISHDRTPIIFRPEQRKAIDEATSDEVIASFVKDAASAQALLAKVKGAYASDPLVLTQIATVSQWVMLPDAWYNIFWDGLHASGRKVWVEQLLEKAATSSDNYIKVFCLDQLRWCAGEDDIDDILEIGAKSGDKAVKEFAETVARGLRKAK
jgi:hypothetical protein